MSEPSLRRATVTLVVVIAAAKVLGYIKEAVVAWRFGTSSAVDLYLAAATIPGIAATIVFHSLPNAFVPILAARSSPMRVRTSVLWTAAALVSASIVVWLAAEAIVATTVSGFSAADRVQTASLLRVAAWGIGLAALEAITRSRLLWRRQFAAAGVGMAAPAVVILLLVIVFPEHGARTLVWGFVGGLAAATLWNILVGLRSSRRAAEVPPAATSPGSSMHPVRWVASVVALDSLAQLFTLVDRHLGSYLGPGALASLQYANLVAFLPFSVLGMGLTMAIFPFLSEAVAAGDRARTAWILDRAIRWSLLAVVPIAVWLFLLRHDIVRLLFERGAFDEHSRRLTATALGAFSLGLAPNVAAAVLSRVFYASRQWRPILYGSLIGIVSKAVCAWWWAGRFGVGGLAAATAVGYAAWLIPLLSGLRGWVTRLQLLGWARYALTAALLAAVPAVVVIAVLPVALPGLMAHTRSIVQVALIALTGASSLLWIGPRWGLTEAGEAWIWIRRLVFRAS